MLTDHSAAMVNLAIASPAAWPQKDLKSDAARGDRDQPPDGGYGRTHGAVKTAGQGFRGRSVGHRHHGDERGEDTLRRPPVLLDCRIPVHCRFFPFLGLTMREDRKAERGVWTKFREAGDTSSWLLSVCPRPVCRAH